MRPSCLVGDCPEPGGIPFSRRTSYNGPYNRGSEVTYSCYNGGSITITCQGNGTGTRTTTCSGNIRINCTVCSLSALVWHQKQFRGLFFASRSTYSEWSNHLSSCYTSCLNICSNTTIRQWQAETWEGLVSFWASVCVCCWNFFLLGWVFAAVSYTFGRSHTTAHSKQFCIKW